MSRCLVPFLAYILSFIPLLAQQSPGFASVPQSTNLIAFMATPVDMTYTDGTAEHGTGFFFRVYSPADPTIKGPQWRQVLKTYVVTNRHVIKPQKFDSFETLSFSLRKQVGAGTDWVPVTIKNKEEIGKRLHLIRDSPIDVAAIDVGDLVEKEYQDAYKSGGNTLSPVEAITSENYPGASPLTVEAGDDVIVIGYPSLFLDEYNKLPMLKRGLLITPWGMKFDGQDEFLIDYKGFHGDSGGLVISRPTDITVKQGPGVNNLLLSETKHFIFLGVYSGEPTKPGKMTETDDAIVQEKIRVDTGQVWYWYTVQQTIDAPAFGK
jgi:hypothetical protein